VTVTLKVTVTWLLLLDQLPAERFRQQGRGQPLDMLGHRIVMGFETFGIRKQFFNAPNDFVLFFKSDAG
jgi:hypothetical protein